jgi:hypothetical protein
VEEGIPGAVLVKSANQSILKFLADKSAHSDVASELVKAVVPLPGVRVFCPDLAAYRFLAATVDDVIFAAAFGMAGIALRLDDAARAIALVDLDAKPLVGCGPEWVSCTLFRSDRPPIDLARWAGLAFSAAQTA